jgi:hypothetical protein
MENLTNGSEMNDDANAHYEDEVNGKVDKIGFEEDATDKSKKCLDNGDLYVSFSNDIFTRFKKMCYKNNVFRTVVFLALY